MSIQSDAMRDLIQRFAISALSRERKNEAINEEILAGKYTGEFYIKTKDGLVLSVDVINRMKSMSHDVIRIAELLNMSGEVFRVDFENMILPSFIDYETNVLQQEPIELPNCSEVVVYLDIDEYDVMDDVPTPIQSEGVVEFVFEVIKDSVVSNIQINNTLNNINYFKIPFEDFDKITSIRLSSIVINKDDKVYTESESNRVMVLHNIFVTLNY
jgi:hypothetical protein